MKQDPAVHDKPAIERVRIRGEWFDVALNDTEQANFWRNISTWEPSTFSFVEQHTAPGVIFVDIGAWIGPITLYAARRGAAVVSIEPDPIAHAALQQNLILNDLNAELISSAIHTHDLGLTLYEGRKGFGDSMTTSMKRTIGREIAVPTITALQLMSKISKGYKCVAIKMDIEGHEYVVGGEISNLRRTLQSSGIVVPLHLSVHPRILHKSQRGRPLRSTRSLVRRDTRNLLTAFDSKGTFDCENGASLSARDVTSRFVPSWPRTIRNFSVILTKSL